MCYDDDDPDLTNNLELHLQGEEGMHPLLYVY